MSIVDIHDSELGPMGDARACGARLWMASVLRLPGAAACVRGALEGGAERAEVEPRSACEWLLYAREHLGPSAVGTALAVLSESGTLSIIPN